MRKREEKFQTTHTVTSEQEKFPQTFEAREWKTNNLFITFQSILTLSFAPLFPLEPEQSETNRSVGKCSGWEKRQNDKFFFFYYPL